VSNGLRPNCQGLRLPDSKPGSERRLACGVVVPSQTRTDTWLTVAVWVTVLVVDDVVVVTVFVVVAIVVMVVVVG
jgi:hypothetical protein